jgi:Flp pilus assembly protein TadD
MRSEAARHPDRPEALYSLGVAEARAGEFDAAVQAFQRAAGLAPKFGPAHSSLAMMYYVGGNYAASWTEVKAAREAGTEPDPAFLAALRRKAPQ